MFTVMQLFHLLILLLLLNGARGNETIPFPDDNGHPVDIPMHCRQLRSLNVHENLGSKIRFYLYIRMGNSVDFTQMKINESLPATFLRMEPTKILIHGFINTLKSIMIQKIKDAYLDSDKNLTALNVIAVDWGDLAGLSAKCYIGPKENTKIVGRYLGQFIDFLVSAEGLSLHKLHVIGHSLGAHVAGIAGKHVASGKIGRITGLDPAGVLYGTEGVDSKLDKSDADFVDVIHTDTGKLGLGYRPPCGHVDFYPHGGGSQPGCGVTTCSHSRAHMYFAESVRRARAYDAYPCDTLSDVTHCSASLMSSYGGCQGCRSNSSNYMGEDAQLLEDPLYFTSPEFPEESAWDRWGLPALLGVVGVLSTAGLSSVAIKWYRSRLDNDHGVDIQ